MARTTLAERYTAAVKRADKRKNVGIRNGAWVKSQVADGKK